MDRVKRPFVDEDEESGSDTPFISDGEGGIAQWVDGESEPLQSEDDESGDEGHQSASENEVRFGF